MTDYAAAPVDVPTPGDEPDAPKKRTQDNGLTKAEEKKILEEARRRMKYAMEKDASDRKRAAEELRFVWNKDNCQWDEDAKKARETRPMLTENRNPSFIRQATNEVRRSRPQIRVLPVDNQSDPYTAQIYEGLIRAIEANSRADMSYDQATDMAGFCGRGYWKVCTKYQDEGFEQDIVIEPVPDPFSIVDDPDCVYPDKSDRKYAFEVEKVDREEFEGEYGFKPASFEDATTALGDHAEYWQDTKNVVVANYWRVTTEKTPIYRMSDGEIVPDAKAYVAQLQAAQQQMSLTNPQMALAPPILPQVVDNRDLVKRKVEWYCVTGMRAISKGEWVGQYIPLVYTTCEQMKIDGKYHTKGMTFDAQDLTKANNYLLSAQIENIALTPKMGFVGAKGQFESDKNKWNSINTKNHPFVEYDPGEGETPMPPPQRPTPVSAQPEIAQVRAGVIDGQRSVVGLMGASLGDQGPEQSFVAISARQSRGDTAIFHVMDNLVRAVRYTGLVIVDLIPRIKSKAEVIRIINPDGDAVMQAINKAFVDPKTGEARMVDLTIGKYDVAVSAGPAFETQRQQDNSLLVELTGKIPQMAQVAPDLITKRLMSSGDGDKIAQRLARTVDPSILGEGPTPAEKQLQGQLQGLTEQMKQLTTQKDFFESELAKQKSLLDKAQVDKDKAIAQLQGELQSAQLDIQKKGLEVEKAQIALLRAQMPAPAANPAPFQ